MGTVGESSLSPIREHQFQKSEAKTSDVTIIPKEPGAPPIEIKKTAEEEKQLHFDIIKRYASHLKDEEITHIVNYIQEHKKEYTEVNVMLQRKATGLSRTIGFYQGHIYVFLNRKAAGDKLLGHGTYKVVTRVINLSQGYLAAKGSIKDQRMREEVKKAMERVRGIPGFIQSKAEFMKLTRSGSVIKKLEVEFEEYQGSLCEMMSKLTAGQRKQVANQIVEAMAQLHQRNLIHRDFKPQNILLRMSSDKNVECAIGDIDTVCSKEDEAAKNWSTTPWYAPPEVAKAARHRLYAEKPGVAPFRYDELMDKQFKEMKEATDLPLDVWSVGCVLYELAYDEIALPLEARAMEDSGVNWLAHLSQEIWNEYHLEPDKEPDSFARVIWEMIQVDPKQRPTLAQVEARMKNPSFIWRPLSQSSR